MVVSRTTVVLLGLVAAASVASAQAKQSGKASSKATSPGKQSAAPARLRFVVAPNGNEARYRVREQFVNVDLPNDAVGVTKDVAGSLIVDAKGGVVRDSSKIVVTLTNLKSDKDRRDNFLKRRTMETEKFPTVELVPTAIKGLALKPSGTTAVPFEIIGDLTVHGVTRPTTWTGTARAEGDDVVGTVTTMFTFKDFSLEQPRVPVLLSIADTIKLEYDFRFTTQR